MNVGKNSDGSCYVGSDSKIGNHWSSCFYDSSNDTLTYGDTLGWAVPVVLFEKVQIYLNAIYQEKENSGTIPHLKL